MDSDSRMEPAEKSGRTYHAPSKLSDVKTKTKAVVSFSNVTNSSHGVLMIMNAHGPNNGPGTADRRKRIIQKTILDLEPRVVLFQEFKWKTVNGRTWKATALPEYYHLFQNDEASLLVDIREVVVSAVDDTKLRRLLDKLQRTPNNCLRVAFPQDFQPLPRMTIKIIKFKQDLQKSFICVSWHGRWNKRNSGERKTEFTYLMEFLRHVKEELDNKPLLVAGDFNIDIGAIKELVHDPFKLYEYQASERRIASGVKDYFIASKELSLSSMFRVDFDRVKNLDPKDKPNDIFDHDPVVCEATLKRKPATEYQAELHQISQLLQKSKSRPSTRTTGKIPNKAIFHYERSKSETTIKT